MAGRDEVPAAARVCGTTVLLGNETIPGTYEDGGLVTATAHPAAASNFAPNS